MDLPVMPPVKPMLAKAVKGVPTGDYSFEPKWDLIRGAVFRPARTADQRDLML